MRPLLLVLCTVVLAPLSWQCGQYGLVVALAAATTSVRNNNNQRQPLMIQVSTVQSPGDMLSLADLRYQEWMANEEDPPSLAAFQSATVEICQERIAEGAVILLARCCSNEHAKEHGTVVGAAELSPMEVQGCCLELLDGTSATRQGEGEPARMMGGGYLYVTDVVTAKSHRRQGIAAKLMQAVEQRAAENMTRKLSNRSNKTNMGSSSFALLLHVDPENDAALAFYRALGYEQSETISQELDVHRLANNAGVQGQLLLSKIVPCSTSTSTAVTKTGAGFGVQASNRNTSKKSKKRVKK